MGISWWWLDEFDMAVLAVLVVMAVRWGASPERLCVTVLITMEAVDALYHFIAGRGAFYHSVDVGHLVIDSLAAAALLAVALNANRIYPLWLSAFQLISVLAHFARETSGTVAALAYAYLAYAPFYLEVTVLGVAIAMHARRVRQSGIYRSWRTSSNRSRGSAQRP